MPGVPDPGEPADQYPEQDCACPPVSPRCPAEHEIADEASEPPAQAEQQRKSSGPPDEGRPDGEDFPDITGTSPAFGDGARRAPVERDGPRQYCPADWVGFVGLEARQTEAELQHPVVVLVPGVDRGPDGRVVAISGGPVPIVSVAGGEPACPRGYVDHERSDAEPDRQPLAIAAQAAGEPATVPSC